VRSWIRSSATCEVVGHSKMRWISDPVTPDGQYRHTPESYVSCWLLSMVSMWIEMDWWCWDRSLRRDMGLRCPHIVRYGGSLYRLCEGQVVEEEMGM